MKVSERVHNQIRTRVADSESDGTKNNIAQHCIEHRTHIWSNRLSKETIFNLLCSQALMLIARISFW